MQPPLPRWSWFYSNEEERQTGRGEKLKFSAPAIFIDGFCCFFFFGSWSAHKCADHELPALQDLLKGEKTSNYERENESNYKIPGLDCIPCIGTNSFVRRKLFRLEFGNWNSTTVACTCTIGTNVFQKNLRQNILTKETNSSSFRVKILFEGIP